MVQKIITKYISDISGEDAEDTITFAVEGKSYRIDLTAAEGEEMRRLLHSYVEVATKIPRTARGTSRGATPATSKAETAKIREWAIKNGYDVADRGRIPQTIREAYHAAT